MNFIRFALLACFIFLGVFKGLSGNAVKENSMVPGETYEEGTIESETTTNSNIMAGTLNGTSYCDAQSPNSSKNEISTNLSDYNASAHHNSSAMNSSTTIQVSCLERGTGSEVDFEIVDSHRLVSLLQIEANVTSREVPGNCVLVLFYSPTCPFSCHAAPFLNALPRCFPDIKMVAIDAFAHRFFNAQLGIFGIPALILFHNGRPAARLNSTLTFHIRDLATFITATTNIKPAEELELTVDDFAGPLPHTLAQDTDYYLVLAWMVIATRLAYSFYRSSMGRWLVDATLNAWREAEAQENHHHME